MIKFINLKDSTNSPINGQPLFDEIFHVNLPADMLVSLDVATLAPGADACMISSTGNFIVSSAMDIVLPTAAVFERTKAYLNPSLINIGNVYEQLNFITPQILYFRAPAQTLIYVAFFSVT
jgi:hypothetical protein